MVLGLPTELLSPAASNKHFTLHTLPLTPSQNNKNPPKSHSSPTSIQPRSPVSKRKLQIQKRQHLLSPLNDPSINSPPSLLQKSDRKNYHRTLSSVTPPNLLNLNTHLYLPNNVLPPQQPL